MHMSNLCKDRKNSILVLGGTGFIGTKLAGYFCKAGHMVYSLARNPHDTYVGSGSYCGIEGNINNSRLIEPLLEQCPVIIHAASDSVPGDTVRAPLCEAYNNLLPTIALIEALQRFENRHIIFISSGGAVYGNPEKNPAPESAHCNPISYHGACKLSLESFLFSFTHQTQNRVTVLRPSNIYGPGQQATKGFGLIRAVLSSIINESEFTIWGDGSITKDYLYIDDFVLACDKILNSSGRGKYSRYNVGYGKGYSINEICLISEEVTGRRLKKTYKDARIIDPYEIILDTGKIRAETGWHPEIDIKEGISRVWESLRSETFV
jgi:UDP-glucose 4-epimerase